MTTAQGVLRIEPWREIRHDGVTQGYDYNGPLFGLGQHQNGKFDYRGTTVRLQQVNRDVAVPMLATPDGFGILWNNAAVTDVEVGLPAGHNPVSIRSEAGQGVDYHFILGPELDEVVAARR